MELCTYAVNEGFPEAIIRGLRASFLSEANYNQMKNCNAISELKALLEETDYASYLLEHPANIHVSVLRSVLRKKLADEFQYIKAQSVEPLNSFLELISHQYMIDNVVNVLEGLKNKVDMKVLESNCEPLGFFPEISNLGVLEGDDYTGLYKDVLIDSPVGPYFMRFLEDSIKDKNQTKTLAEIQQVFKDMKSEQIRISLKKMWLEEFYNFCQKTQGGFSLELMSSLLYFEADFKTIQVIYNSIASKDLQSNKDIVELRSKLCPTIGYLYPDITRTLFSIMSLDGMRDSLKNVEGYRDLIKEAPDPSKKEDFSVNLKSLDDIIYDEETKRYAEAFDCQAQFPVFYGYIKLKEQEIRNIIWLAEMIARKLPKTHAGWKKIIIPFSHLKD